MTYKINGSSASIAPYAQQWIPLPVGTDHNGQVVFSANHDVILQFEGGSIVHTQQWLNAVSAGSCTLQILDRWSTGYRQVSPVYVEISQFPTMEAGISGPFTLVVHGATIL